MLQNLIKIVNYFRHELYHHLDRKLLKEEIDWWMRTLENVEKFYPTASTEHIKRKIDAYYILLKLVIERQSDKVIEDYCRKNGIKFPSLLAETKRAK